MKRSSPNGMSKKRRSLLPARRDTVKFVLERDEYLCQIGLYPSCSRHATDVHEILTRARGGSITDAENCIALCRGCHNFVTVNTKWGERHGFVLPSWAGVPEIVAAARARAVWKSGLERLEFGGEEEE
jgi:5-methylcytosine-specific restriction endonuclease McrA